MIVSDVPIYSGICANSGFGSDCNTKWNRCSVPENFMLNLKRQKQSLEGANVISQKNTSRKAFSWRFYKKLHNRCLWVSWVNSLVLPCPVNSELQNQQEYLPMLEAENRYYRKKELICPLFCHEPYSLLKCFFLRAWAEVVVPVPVYLLHD